MRIRNLLSLLAFSLCAAAQPGPPPWMERAFEEAARHRPRRAYLEVRPEPGGDVQLSLASRDLPQPFSLPLAARLLPGCDWRTLQSDEEQVSGRCRGLLHNDHGLVDGWLPLAPLAFALRLSGASYVTVYLELDPSRGEVLAPPPGWRREDRRFELTYGYTFEEGQPPPPPIHIRLGTRRESPEPLAPILVVLLAPAAIALCLRLRWARRADRPGLVYVPWIMLGTWFFWLFTLSPTRVADFASYLPWPYLPLRLLLGSALFLLPPLVASALVEGLLGNRSGRIGSGLAGWLRRTLPSDTPIVVLSGFLLVGLGMSRPDGRAPILGLAAGLAALAGMVLLLSRGAFPFLRPLESGEFHDRVLDLARKAGVRLRGVSLWQGASPQEANAGALLRSRKIVIADSLLALLSKREADAAVAHELGHLRGLRLLFVPSLVLSYIPFYLAFQVVPWADTLLPQGEGWLLFLALGVVLLASRIRCGNELQADALGAQTTGDPEAVIAMLARLNKLHRFPLEWSRSAGWILTHPSVRDRVLALAWRFQIPAPRALALLEDPGALEPDQEMAHYAVASESDLVFSLSADGRHRLKLYLVTTGALALLLFGWAYAVSRLLAGRGALVETVPFLLGLPALYWPWCQIGRWWDRRFLKNMMRRVGQRLPGQDEDAFVALRPGYSMYVASGRFAWDLGRVFLRAGRLVYVGERTGFSLPRCAVLRIEAERAWLGQRWNHGVVVVFQGGSFAIQGPLDARSAPRAAALASQLERWWKADAAAPETDPVFGDLPFPDLPALPPAPPVGRRAVLASAFFPFLTSLVLYLMLPGGFLNALALLATPVFYLITVAPLLRSVPLADK
ncbi:MAG: M48 family metalloprotease [Bryobacteraceae bacterium]